MPFEHSPLPSDHPLFRRPDNELRKLTRACQQGNQNPWLIYGEYQMGKTTFLNALASDLRTTGTYVCEINLAAYRGIHSMELVYKNISDEVARVTTVPNNDFRFCCPLDLEIYLRQVIEALNLRRDPQISVIRPCLVLLIDNYGQLEKLLQDDLSDGLVCLAEDRPKYTELSWVTLVITGGNFAQIDTGLSRLVDQAGQNILTLPELREEDTVILVQTGLKGHAGISADRAASIGKYIYQRTEGHPALVHMLGTMFEKEYDEHPAEGDEQLMNNAADCLVETLLGPSQRFYKRVAPKGDLQLAKEACIMEKDSVPYRMSNDAVKRQAWIGLIKGNSQSRCVIRNGIFRRVLSAFP
ncbi:MAG: hypothetical protein JW862_02945 [Anaerolineales bacterium]|nr:hypothetical protein [Anaerolineales bacterium]